MVIFAAAMCVNTTRGLHPCSPVCGSSTRLLIIELVLWQPICISVPRQMSSQVNSGRSNGRNPGLIGSRSIDSKRCIDGGGIQIWRKWVLPELQLMANDLAPERLRSGNIVKPEPKTYLIHIGVIIKDAQKIRREIVRALTDWDHVRVCQRIVR